MTIACSSACVATPGAWPTVRILFLLAGTVTLLSAGLAAAVSPWFVLLAAFAGFNQLLYVAVGACPASLVIERCRPTSPAYANGMLDPHHHEET